MRATPLLLLAGFGALPGVLRAQSGPPAMDTVLALRLFREAAELTAGDGGRLWGRPLAGPLLLVHPASRAVLSDTPASDRTLRPLGSLFEGTLPDAEPIANTALRWAGRTWAMIVWPPVPDSLRRRILLAHELWHRVQDSLGFVPAMPANSHLGTQDARIWLRLEGRALRAALDRTGPPRARAIADAAAFRRERHRRFPGAGAEENALELNEGLAEYTGIVLATPLPAARAELAARRLAQLDSTTNLERDFAYHTGPAWGLLLDDLAPAWRTKLRPGDDLAFLAVSAPGVPRTAGGSPAVRGASYGLAALRRSEQARTRAREEHLRAVRVRFVTGPLLELPLSRMKMSFDPAKVEALDGQGSVYGMLRLSDRWGVLQCDESGGLLTADFSRAVIPAPADTSGRRLTGPGWVLELLPGWRLAPGTRPGDWTIREVPEGG